METPSPQNHSFAVSYQLTSAIMILYKLFRNLKHFTLRIVYHQARMHNFPSFTKKNKFISTKIGQSKCTRGLSLTHAPFFSSFSQGSYQLVVCSRTLDILNVKPEKPFINKVFVHTRYNIRHDDQAALQNGIVIHQERVSSAFLSLFYNTLTLCISSNELAFHIDLEAELRCILWFPAAL